MPMERSIRILYQIIVVLNWIFDAGILAALFSLTIEPARNWMKARKTLIAALFGIMLILSIILIFAAMFLNASL